MAVQVTINSVTGQSPYDIYICQSGGTGCFYITTISTIPYVFDIPAPYDTSSSYMLKVVDDNDCIISGVESVNSTPTPTPTNTSTPTTTPTNTPTNTSTPTTTPTNTTTPTSTQILTSTPTPTPTETSTPTCDCTRYEVFKNGGNPLIEVINCDGDTQLIRPAGYGSVSDTIFVCSTVMPTSGDWTTLITNGSCCSEFVDCSGYTITNLDLVSLDIFYTDCQFGFMSYSLPVGDNITVCSYTTPYSTGFPNLSVINNGSCNPY
jgi:hypothetical protein